MFQSISVPLVVQSHFHSWIQCKLTKPELLTELSKNEQFYERKFLPHICHNSDNWVKIATGNVLKVSLEMRCRNCYIS